MPALTLMSVVLPAPLGPTIETKSAGPTDSEISRSATAAPYLASTDLSSSMRFPEKSGDDVAAPHHLFRRSLRDDLAVVEHDDAVRQRPHRAHHVLDEHDRRAFVADPADEANR